MDRERQPGCRRRLLALTEATIARLERFPLIGVPREELAAGLRSIRIRPFPHLIFYRVDGEMVTLVRLLHGARDLANLGIET
ncbi:MAG: type II toxin-antitoxin system RelE/ParE family toxin [Caulobacterales bacterium]